MTNFEAEISTIPCMCIGAGGILNVRGQDVARAQKFKPRPLINDNAFVKLMAKMKKQ